jgi:hypothetical protein
MTSPKYASTDDPLALFHKEPVPARPEHEINQRAVFAACMKRLEDRNATGKE